MFRSSVCALALLTAAAASGDQLAWFEYQGGLSSYGRFAIEAPGSVRLIAEVDRGAATGRISGLSVAPVPLTKRESIPIFLDYEVHFPDLAVATVDVALQPSLFAPTIVAVSEPAALQPLPASLLDARHGANYAAWRMFPYSVTVEFPETISFAGTWSGVAAENHQSHPQSGRPNYRLEATLDGGAMAATYRIAGPRQVTATGVVTVSPGSNPVFETLSATVGVARYALQTPAGFVNQPVLAGQLVAEWNTELSVTVFADGGFAITPEPSTLVLTVAALPLLRKRGAK